MSTALSFVEGLQHTIDHTKYSFGLPQTSDKSVQFLDLNCYINFGTRNCVHGIANLALAIFARPAALLCDGLGSIAYSPINSTQAKKHLEAATQGVKNMATDIALRGLQISLGILYVSLPTAITIIALPFMALSSIS